MLRETYEELQCLPIIYVDGENSEYEHIDFLNADDVLKECLS